VGGEREGGGEVKFVCWFSKWFWDIHDYYKNCGGDGVASHFHKYECRWCGKEFEI
jgi:hypothetical protein